MYTRAMVDIGQGHAFRGVDKQIFAQVVNFVMSFKGGLSGLRAFFESSIEIYAFLSLSISREPNAQFAHCTCIFVQHLQHLLV